MNVSYFLLIVWFLGLKSQPATPIGIPSNNAQMLQAVYTDNNGQPIYIMSQQPIMTQQPTLIPLQLQQPSLQIGQSVSQPSTTQVQLMSQWNLQ